MDDEYARLILGHPTQLPAFAPFLHSFLVSHVASSQSAAGELLSRSDAMGSCLLQSPTITLDEARSGLARAIYCYTFMKLDLNSISMHRSY